MNMRRYSNFKQHGTRSRVDVRRPAAILVVAASLLGSLTGTALADSGNGKGNQSAWLPSYLVSQAQANPSKLFNVIVRGRPGEKSASIATFFNQGGGLGHLKKQFYSINGVAGQLSGADLLKLAQNNHVLSIVPDASVASTGVEEAGLWRASTQVDRLSSLFANPFATAPAIAIVDSGVDSSKLGDFGARVVASVNLSSLSPGASGDDEGHGTMVAGLAAGASALYPGVSPTSPIVSLRTSDARGASRMSDVIAAADWILQNKDAYGIRVANFSMRSDVPSSFRYDPLDAALEQLWFHGVVVVAAVGNYGQPGGVKVQNSPGNDPFIISVGALDTNGTVDPKDDFVAPWSAYGHTLDGFAKPEISAPGRWIVGPVPAGSTLPVTDPTRVVAPGYMWMSGTSLAAPLVSGAAAAVLEAHPSWTPDQVKGALLKAATGLPGDTAHAAGVGELNAAKAVSLSSAPNPNANLERYLVSDGVGGVSFDGTSWEYALRNATDWSATDWSATDWSATDWSATDWSP